MDNLEQILISNLGAQRIPIDQIDASCCTTADSVLPVIDFDEVKVFFCNQALGLPWMLKSADCLHIDITQKAICFIEMKNIAQYFLSNAPLYQNQADFDNAFDKWLKKKTKELKIKIIDSIFIITAAAGKYSSGTNDVARMLDKSDVKISYIVLTNMTNSDYLLYNIASLESKIKYPVLAGPSHRAVTVITADFDTHMSNNL